MEFLGNDEIEFYAVNVSQKAKIMYLRIKFEVTYVHAHVTNEFAVVEFQSSLRSFESGIHLLCASLAQLICTLRIDFKGTL